MNSAGLVHHPALELTALAEQMPAMAPDASDPAPSAPEDAQQAALIPSIAARPGLDLGRRRHGYHSGAWQDRCGLSGHGGTGDRQGGTRGGGADGADHPDPGSVAVRRGLSRLKRWPALNFSAPPQLPNSATTGYPESCMKPSSKASSRPGSAHRPPPFASPARRHSMPVAPACPGSAIW